MAGGAGAPIVTENGSALFAGIGALSTAVTVNFDVPRLVGVPLREPSLAPSVSPVEVARGNAPVQGQ